MTASRGVLMIAHNNTEIDYLKIACANALMVRKHLDVPVTLITNSGTLRWGTHTLGTTLIEECFEKVVVVEPNRKFSNKRNYADTANHSEVLQFHNCDHWEAYELSPYDETLFIDVDYLIMSAALANCWGSNNEIMLNHSIMNVGDTKQPFTKHIDDFGIRQYWATVIYFKKTRMAKFVFDLVKHIQDNYDYYKHLYLFSNGMFRNDYAFSIAIHMLNGFSDLNSTVHELPIIGLLMSWDVDDILSVNGRDDITLFTDTGVKDHYNLVRLRSQDVHIMNKWSIGRAAARLIELYRIQNE